MDRFFSQKLFLGDLHNKIRDLKVAVVGIGGLGSWLAEFLVRIGIKEIILIDYDIVEEKNLDRQNYLEEDINKLKIDALENRLLKIRKDIIIKKYKEIKIEYLKDVDIFFDCLDDIESKKLLNEISVYLGKKYIFASVAKDQGFVGLIDPKKFCLNDIYNGKEEILSCSFTGLYDSSLLFAVSIMLQLLLDFVKNVDIDYIFHFNLNRYELDKIKVKRLENCEICKNKNYKYIWKLKN